MTRGLAMVAVLASLGLGIGLALPSCSDIPNKTCFADRVHTLTEPDAEVLDRDCTTCLQTKGAPHACCDAVGACQDDPDGGCPAQFKAAHECVLEGGPAEESSCKRFLTGKKSQDLYVCMRGTCATECKIPSCDIDESVVLFGSPTCDHCMSGSCCEEINACYRSRRCKQVLECIIDHCPRTLGPSMTDLGAAPQAVRDTLERAVCSVEGTDPRDGGVGITPCISKCIEAFTSFEDDGGTPDDQAARCLAFQVYLCGASKGHCGPRCVQPDGGSYSGNEPWPEDLPPDSDAGTRPVPDASPIQDASADG